MKEKIIKITKRICFLPPIPTLLIALPSFAFLIAALTGKISIPMLNYIAYILSAYALIITVTGIIRIVSFTENGLREHPLIRQLFSIPTVDQLIHEKRFRTEIALYPGFCINVFYVIFKTVMGIYYRSAWFLSLGIYYLALAIMRFILIHYIRSQTNLPGMKEEVPDLIKERTAGKIDELRRYRMCGCMLFLINAALTGITILAVRKNEGFTYPGYLIYVMAMYAFYCVITAVINLVKYRKYGSPVLSAAKVVNMSTALVSVFSLETAMLAQFGGENTEHFRVMMTALTGAGVSLIVLGMAVYMIVQSSRFIKRKQTKR